MSSSKDSSPKAITISDVTLILERLQPKAHSQGYYLALAGGVLNKGYSYNDIDLVAVPMLGSSKAGELATYLTKYLTQVQPVSLGSRGRPIDLYHFKLANILIDIAIVKNSNNSNSNSNSNH